ncbi:hypothetical protein GJQ57_13700 [Ralstonia pickettii]|uniref:Uncharacterized protein n=1 Tax=Ralstonia pickettii TaxID=329 RepID=A0A7X2HND3_RALPI|nr:hypothetical protein [Ralstonia pickettii]MRS99700.1 hypothetical protein [Ralstonia pickettii]
MNTIQPDYFVGDGRLQLNEAGQRFNELKAHVERETAQFERSWAGAFLASIFLAEPWLAAFDLVITTSHEYDDQGGTYLCFSSSMTAVQVVDGVPLPDTVQGDDGGFDVDLAADYLAEQFDTCERCMFAVFRDDEVETMKIEVRREPIASLLAAGPVSGIEAFRALFPDEASPADAPPAR